MDDKRLEKLSINDKASLKLFYQILKENDFINAISSIYIEGLIDSDLSLQEYQTLLKKILEREDFTDESINIKYYIIKKSEVESFYRYESSVELNDVEVLSWCMMEGIKKHYHIRRLMICQIICLLMILRK